MSPRKSHAPLTREEARAKEERRLRSLQVSTICLHSMGWILATFYATDYLPPLLIRLTVGLHQPARGRGGGRLHLYGGRLRLPIRAPDSRQRLLLALVFLPGGAGPAPDSRPGSQ